MHAEDVALQRGVAAGRRAEQHERHAAEREQRRTRARAGRCTRGTARRRPARSGTARSDPISAAFATLLCVAPAKNTARFSPKKTPGIHTWRTSRSVTRRPVLHRTTFHTRLTATRRQNATSTPGVSARLTSVELSENATTSPTTASTPSVFALRARAGVGDVVAAMLRREPIRRGPSRPSAASSRARWRAAAAARARRAGPRAGRARRVTRPRPTPARGRPGAGARAARRRGG